MKNHLSLGLKDQWFNSMKWAVNQRACIGKPIGIGDWLDIGFEGREDVKAVSSVFGWYDSLDRGSL